MGRETLTEAGPAVRVEPEAGFALTEVGAWRVHAPVMAAAIVHLALIHIWAGTGGRGLTGSTHPGAGPRGPSGTPQEDTAPGPGARTRTQDLPPRARLATVPSPLAHTCQAGRAESAGP